MPATAQEGGVEGMPPARPDFCVPDEGSGPGTVSIVIPQPTEASSATSLKIAWGAS